MEKIDMSSEGYNHINIVNITFLSSNSSPKLSGARLKSLGFTK